MIDEPLDPNSPEGREVAERFGRTLDEIELEIVAAEEAARATRAPKARKRISSRPTEDEYLTVAEVAELWHCDPQTVYRRVYDGELPYINMAPAGARRARIRIRLSAAHQYMADRERRT